MVHGARDDSNIRVEHDVYRLDDMAEFAVRMGSIFNYQRHGSALLLDGFEQGLNAWDKNTTGTNAEVEISNGEAYAGQVACKITTGTGLTPYAGISKYLPPVDESRAGFQGCFSLDSDVVEVRFQLTYGKSPTRYYFYVSYNHVTGVLSYQSAPGVWSPFATPGVLYDFAGNWHNFKMVADLATGKFARFYLDNIAFPMGGLLADTGAWAFGPFLYPLLRVWGNGGVSGVLYLDNVIVTYNEF